MGTSRVCRTASTAATRTGVATGSAGPAASPRRGRPRRANPSCVGSMPRRLPCGKPAAARIWATSGRSPRLVALPVLGPPEERAQHPKIALGLLQVRHVRALLEDGYLGARHQAGVGGRRGGGGLVVTAAGKQR